MSTSHPTTSEVRYHEIKPGYRVGDDGSFWSQWASGKDLELAAEWKQLGGSKTFSGYTQVVMKEEGGGTRRDYLHRLVLEAFAGACPLGMVCRHLDGNPGNNRLDNLAWGTSRENMQDAISHGTVRHGEESGSSVLTEDLVTRILEMSRRGATRSEVAKSLGVHHTTISAVLTGRSWSRFTGIKYAPQRTIKTVTG